MTRVVSFVALIGIVILVSALVFQVMASFLLPMFLAIVMVVVFRPMHRWFFDRFNGRNRLASIVTTAVIMLIVLAPLITTTILAATDLFEFIAGNRQQGNFETRVDKFRDELGLSLPPELDELENHIGQLTRVLRGLEPTEHWNDAADGISVELTEIDRAITANAPPAAGVHDADLQGLFPQVEQLHFEQGQAGKPPELAELEELGFTERFRQFQRTYALLRPTLIRRLDEVRVEKLNHDQDPENDAVAIGTARAWLIAQANPSREQLDDFRTSALEQLGMGSLALSTGQYVSGALGKLILGLFVMVISLYYFLADGPAMVAAVMSISPLENRYGQQMLAEFEKISRAVVMAIVVAAVVQGALATIGYWIAGLDSLFLLCVLTTLLAMIPFVGAASVWIPCSLYLAFSGRPVAGVCLALYGLLVVSMIDNLIKPMVLHGQSKLHPLLALLSIIGGVQALGPIGIFVGPMVVSFLQAVLNMFHAELKALGSEAAAGASGEKPDGPDDPPPTGRRRGRR